MSQRKNGTARAELMRISFVRGKTLKVSSSSEHSFVDFRFMCVVCRFVGASRFMHELRLGSQNVKDMSVKGGVCNSMHAPCAIYAVIYDLGSTV